MFSRMFAEVGLHSMFDEKHWRILAGINHTGVCRSSNGGPGRNEKKTRFGRAIDCNLVTEESGEPGLR
jgi:hypothetical protein